MYKSVKPELGLDVDKDFGAVQLFSKQFLMAVASGQVDANALLEEELASRGYDKDGNWIGCR
ncbi:hypothetical protein [uncultured Desulfovibrio sp.]|uniref:hypothetical protein n=1 Tax=uncultured Desulfovibrio sp. TaxID=167968 RepID=UPI0003AAD9B2|nr:hypothetical protein [uncultured Desulfovibrio sp.]